MRLAYLVLALAACHHHRHDPTLLQSPQPNAWVTVSLVVAGPESDDRKRNSCLEEARAAGIQLATGAPIAGTLNFMDHDDYLEMADAPNGRWVFGAMGSNATCKLALGKLVKIEQFVPMSKAEPQGCQPVGMVEGSDSGFFHPGNYEAAVVEAQFKVRALGGNRFVQDAVQPMGTRVVVNGRGFRCQ
jgi:hypothetical protein